MIGSNGLSVDPTWSSSSPLLNPIATPTSPTKLLPALAKRPRMSLLASVASLPATSELCRVVRPPSEAMPAALTAILDVTVNCSPAVVPMFTRPPPTAAVLLETVLLERINVSSL